MGPRRWSKFTRCSPGARPLPKRSPGRFFRSSDSDGMFEMVGIGGRGAGLIQHHRALRPATRAWTFMAPRTYPFAAGLGHPFFEGISAWTPSSLPSRVLGWGRGCWFAVRARAAALLVALGGFGPRRCRGPLATSHNGERGATTRERPQNRRAQAPPATRTAPRSPSHGQEPGPRRHPRTGRGRARGGPRRMG